MIRWPPRVATSIRYGVVGYVLSLHYVHGIPLQAAVEFAVYGWMDFWGPRLGVVLFTIGMGWVVIDRFRRLFRGP